MAGNLFANRHYLIAPGENVWKLGYLNYIGFPNSRKDNTEKDQVFANENISWNFLPTCEPRVSENFRIPLFKYHYSSHHFTFYGIATSIFLEWQGKCLKYWRHCQWVAA